MKSIKQFHIQHTALFPRLAPGRTTICVKLLSYLALFLWIALLWAATRAYRVSLLALLFSMVSATPATGAEADSVRYRVRATQFIAPAALISLGITGLAVAPVREWNRSVSEHFAGRRPLRFDDYVQYVPVGTPYILKLCGVQSRHSYGEYTVLLATAYLSMGIMVNSVKYSVRELRPDGSSRNSFPSGHTATVFMGAELLRAEFWETSPWIGVGGYAVAAAVGFMRVYNNRHYITDVLAGAGIGILSAKIAYWTFPAVRRIFYGGHKKTGQTFASIVPYYDGSRLGASFGLCF